MAISADGVVRLAAWHDVRNPSSCRVAENAGRRPRPQIKGTGTVAIGGGPGFADRAPAHNRRRSTSFMITTVREVCDR